MDVICKDTHGVQGDRPGREARSAYQQREAVTAAGLTAQREKAVAGIQRDGGWSCRQDRGAFTDAPSQQQSPQEGSRELARNRSTSLFPASALLPGRLLAKSYRKPEGM